MQDRGSDDVLTALEAVAQAAEANIARLRSVTERVERLRDLRLTGMTYSDVVEQAERPLIVELLTANLLELQRAGYRLRVAEARALYTEGLTMNRIAELFGVSQQRVSALLRSEPREDRDPDI